MRRTYIYRSPFCGWTLEVSLNKRRKTVKNKRLQTDYSHTSSGLREMEYEMWIHDIAVDLEEEGFLG